MLIPICALVFALGASQAPERLKTALDNGVTILAERQSGAASFAAYLFVAARGEDETPATHGVRHLLEHLLAKGPGGQIDVQLESAGMVLDANTLRDATSFEIEGPAARLDAGLDALRSLLKSPSFSAAEVAKEALIVAEELVLETRDRRFSISAWTALFGENSLDPTGSAAALSKVKPEQLAELYRRMFRSAHLVVAVRSNLDPQEVSRKVAALFADLPKTEPTPWQERSPVDAKDAQADAQGAALAARVPSLSDPRTAWTLAAGLALASQMDESFLTYTPSIRPAALTVGSLAAGANASEFLKTIDLLGQESAFRIGRNLAIRWCQWRAEDTEASLYWTGYLLAQGWGASVDALRANVESMTLEQFRRGLSSLGEGSAVKLSGIRKPKMGDGRGAEIRRSDWGRAQPASPIGPKRQAIVRPNPKAPDLCVEAVVPLTGIGDVDPGAAQVMAECLLLDNGVFSARQIRETCSQAGVAPSVEAMPDHIRISLRFPPGRLRDAVPMLAAMLTRAEFTPQAIKKAMERIEHPESVWERALSPIDPGSSLPTSEALRQVYEAACRPERVVVVFGGAVDGLEALRLWNEKVDGWHVEPAKALPTPSSPLFAWRGHDSPVSTFEWRGPEFPAWDAALSTRMVAVAALGFGKGSTLYRLVREQRGLSYRQDAFLWPSPFGFRPRLLFASKRMPDAAAVDALRKQLLVAVASWTETDLARAKGIVRSAVDLRIVEPPIVLSARRALRPGDESDRLFEEAYWVAKTGAAFDRARLLSRIDLVPLQDIKDMASEWLERAEPLLIPGLGER